MTLLCLLCVVLALLALPAQTSGDDWIPAANARIDRHRKSDFTVTLTLPDGRPAAGAAVTVTQTRSAFHFGTAVNEGLLLRHDESAQRYRAQILRWFNTVVPENAMKWYTVEREAGAIDFTHADGLMKFAAENNLAVRGHCLLWAKEKYNRPWVLALDQAPLQAAVDTQIARMVKRYQGRLLGWDVNNEMLDGAMFQNRLGAPARAAMFKQAHALDPKAALFINEYGILGGDAKLQRYIDLVRDLQHQGAPVGGLGIQEHRAERFSPSEQRNAPDPKHPERFDSGPLNIPQVLARLDKLAALKLPIHLTEVSFFTEHSARRAEAVENFYRLAYSHPQVEAVLVWGFWEKSHWGGLEAALVDKDWKLLPAGAALERLLLNEWRTNTTVTADAAGVIRFRGFHGTYRLQTPTGTATATLTAPTPTARAALKPSS